MKKKVSVICTVLNEEKNMEKFLKSIELQTRKPDEVVIVDGGSQDKTYKIIKDFAKKHKWLKPFQLKKSNISKGRNYAISKTKNEIIVGTDAGTKYEKNWLEELTMHFKGGLGFGRTLPLIENGFQKVLAKGMRQRYGSSRNIIFNKGAWKEAGGYPEDLDIAEDTVFNKRMEKIGLKTQRIPSAVGYWEMRQNIEEVERQFYNYGKWSRIAQDKYRVFPLRYKTQIAILSLLLPLYPLIKSISKISSAMQIFVIKKFSYLKGYNEEGRK